MNLTPNPYSPDAPASVRLFDKNGKVIAGNTRGNTIDPNGFDFIGATKNTLAKIGASVDNAAKAAPSKSPGSTYTAPSYADIQAAKKAKLVGKLRNETRGYAPEVNTIYDQLFADIDTLLNSRRKDIEETSGRSIGDLTKKYVSSIPGIENSYSAVGAGDSTWAGDSKDDAKEGFESSVKQVGDQKGKDLAALSQYGEETKAGWNADREALNRIFSRLDETDNENDLAAGRNTVETKLAGAKANRATLMTDEGLKGKINAGTDSSSRLAGIQSSLDSILNSSMANSVKDAAVQAVGQSAGLSDAEKDQIKRNSAYTS